MENFRLKVFRAVARHLNFRKAAEQLCLTQPAVTLQIKALEQYLGVQLFDRSQTHISLTPAGTKLLRYAEKIEKLEAAVLAELSTFTDHQRGDLRIGASLTVAQYILPHLLGAFQVQHPLVRPSIVTCNTEEVVESLVQGKVAVGFIEGPSLRRDIRTEAFLEDEIVLMAPPAHEWSDRSSIELEELKEERLLMREIGSGTRRVVEMALQKHGLKIKHLNVAMEIDSTEGITTAVEAGLGIGFASLWAIGKELREGSVRAVPIRGVRITRQLSFAYPRGRELQGIALAFHSFLRSRHHAIAPPGIHRPAS